jgi:Peptidase family M28
MKRICWLAIVAIAAGSEPGQQAALDRISASSLRMNLSFLASDELEGRNTPSPGLDRAADYIADRFRRAGVEPAAADRSYFQVAKFDQSTPNLTGFKLLLKTDDRQIDIPASETRPRSLSALDLEDQRVTLLPEGGALPPVAGMVVAGTQERYGDDALLEELQSRKPALILLIDKSGEPPREKSFLDDEELHHAPVIVMTNSAALDLVHRGTHFTLTLHVARPAVKEVLLRNVVGLLPGSDPVLRDQYVLLTAHYDHLGKGPKGIFNGANDNASGTVSVIEIAKALAALNPPPKRSILFMTFFGEEEGLLGSYYYAHSPLFPLANTVAVINLEQMGRTDDTGGKRLLSFTITGQSFSNLPEIVSAAARTEGIRTWTLKDTDAYFDRSDNYGFALHGVVAHTIAVAAEFPDYHAVGDTWQKIDFANMAKVDRGVAAGLLRIAEDPSPPQWSDALGARAYRAASSARSR